MRAAVLMFITGFVLASCGGMAYRFYVPDMPDECYDKGFLRANEPKDDKELKLCKPDLNNKGKCNVMISEELERLISHDKACSIQLDACEHRCPAN